MRRKAQSVCMLGSETGERLINRSAQIGEG